jgi:protein involved in polysaccharide export with SLBB domain
MIRINIYSTVVVAILLGGGAAIMQAQGARTAPASNLVAAKIATPVPDTATSSEPQLEQRYPRYVIQRQDVLKLSFPLSPEMNQTVTVQPDGYISLQSAGGLHVQGLTVPELVEALKKAYTGVLHDPIINVDLDNFQQPFFTASGQVGKPGKYILRSDITIAEALAIAGGMTPEAKTQIFLFHKTSSGWVETRKVNMKDILQGKNVNEDASIKPGDMIYVPEKFIANFKKYVPYSFGTYITPVP